MSTRSEDGLFGALEAELKKAKEPLDCVDLFNKASIRRHAETVNRVSDYLGNLWRKGKVVRLPAPKGIGNKSRWMYTWKSQPLPRKADVPLTEAIVFEPELDKLVGKPNVKVSDSGDTVSITLPNMIITIRSRPQ